MSDKCIFSHTKRRFFLRKIHYSGKMDPIFLIQPCHILMRVPCQNLRFHRHMSCMVFFVCVKWFEWGVVIRFVDVDGIVDHHSLNFLFIINRNSHIKILALYFYTHVVDPISERITAKILFLSTLTSKLVYSTTDIKRTRVLFRDFLNRRRTTVQSTVVV
jgi:hypothetical protein